ncbi:MAG: glycosyltransferase family 4 protein, partial [bacterium]
HRASRPAFRQSSNIGRMLNAFWLMAKRLTFIARSPTYDIVVLGTDPQFAYFMLPFARLLKRRSKLVYWAFDLYPEAVAANDMGLCSKLVSLSKPLTRFCYSRLDGIVDIGPCMRRLLDKYEPRGSRATLVPWALFEPHSPPEPDPKTRRELFGDAKLTLLYSGNIGKAHAFECFIALARELRRRGASVAFCFAGRGYRYEQIRSLVSEADTNISFAGFASDGQLAKRLGAGDIHMISLREGWEGIVVPSKFFGALAMGKPLLYEGTPKSCIREWISEEGIGFYITENNIQEIADKLEALALNSTALAQFKKNAFDLYRQRFSKQVVMDGWNDFLNELVK